MKNWIRSKSSKMWVKLNNNTKNERPILWTSSSSKIGKCFGTQTNDKKHLWLGRSNVFSEIGFWVMALRSSKNIEIDFHSYYNGWMKESRLKVDSNGAFYLPIISQKLAKKITQFYDATLCLLWISIHQQKAIYGVKRKLSVRIDESVTFTVNSWWLIFPPSQIHSESNWFIESTR